MRPLLGVLLLAGLLVAGRTALACHHYEHDAATPDTKCELCHLSQISKHGLAQIAAAHAPDTVGVAKPSAARPVAIVFPLTAYWSRAPPSILV